MTDTQQALIDRYGDRERAGKVATDILSALGCSFEILWPEHKHTIDEVIAAQRQERERIRSKGDQAALDLLLDLDVSDFDSIRAALVEAYRQGYMASPKPVTAVLR